MGSGVPQGQSQLHDGMNKGIGDQQPSPYSVSESSGDWRNISHADDRGFNDDGDRHVNVNLALNGRTMY